MTLTDIRSAHVDIDFEDLTVFESSLLQRIIAGSRRLRGETNTKERRSIIKDVLLQLLSHFDRHIRHEVIMQTIFCLAFAIFLRIDEFTYSAKDMKNKEFGQ